MQYIKHIIFCLIIFSNTCFGKEFDKLFVVYDPIDNASEIEKSINNSFNTMIYRLSGTNSPSNIWKIINAGNYLYSKSRVLHVDVCDSFFTIDLLY